MDAYTSVAEMTEDKVAVCVYMCVCIACLLYPLTHWWVRMYLLLRGKEEEVPLCARTHHTVSIHSPTEDQPEEETHGARHGERTESSKLSPSQPCTLPPTPCGQQSWMPDENF